MTTSFMHSLHTRLSPTSLLPPIPLPSSFLSHGCPQSTQSIERPRKTRTSVSGRSRRARGIACGFLPVDPWAPTIDSQSIATQLFAFSLFPYLGFLYFITKSSSTPKLTLFGFYFLLAFVGATNSVRNFSTNRKEHLSICILITIFMANCILLYLYILSTRKHPQFDHTDQLLVAIFVVKYHAFGPVPAGIYAKVSYGTSLSNVDWLHGGAESLLTLTNLFVVLGLRKALRQRKD